LVQASTVQILGAEKALFRALKTKHETPKYGLIYHASLIGQASPKNKVQVQTKMCPTCCLRCEACLLQSLVQRHQFPPSGQQYYLS